mmetsp:Transcript_26676/g.57609  ORF Transcript_26676/g.57609 Transcript_26676/m.57609 type:complete len:218 (-) Transcript_26676:268-921(-)
MSTSIRGSQIHPLLASQCAASASSIPYMMLSASAASAPPDSSSCPQPCTTESIASSSGPNDSIASCDATTINHGHGHVSLLMHRHSLPCTRGATASISQTTPAATPCSTASSASAAHRVMRGLSCALADAIGTSSPAASSEGAAASVASDHLGAWAPWLLASVRGRSSCAPEPHLLNTCRHGACAAERAESAPAVRSYIPHVWCIPEYDASSENLHG